MAIQAQLWGTCVGGFLAFLAGGVEITKRDGVVEDKFCLGSSCWEFQQFPGRQD